MSANEILGLRLKLGLTQAEFWARLGISQSGGSRYEKGRRLPKPVRLLLKYVYGEHLA